MSAAIVQVPEHEPFPIADADIGLYLAKEPWLSPSNAFSEMRDAYTFRSRVRQRPGFQRFAQCAQTSAGTHTASSVSGGGNFYVNYTLDSSSEYLALESVDFTYTDSTNGALAAAVGVGEFGEYAPFGAGSETWGLPIYEDGTTTLIGVVRQRYDSTVAVPAAATIDWSLHSDYATGDATLGSMTWREDPRLAITGLQSYRDRAGDEYFIATNTRRIFVYNESTNLFEDQAGSNTFTGDADDLFWMWPAENDMILTNGVDAPYKYTGSTTTLATLTTTIGAGPATVQVARLAVVFQNRLIYFRTQEAGSAYPRRARWSRAGAFETLDMQDFTDAPTELGPIITAAKIADRLFVGFLQGWMELVYTGDPQSLFEWRETTYTYGANAKLGVVSDGERIMTRTETGIQAIDPNSQYPADVTIPDYVIDRMDSSLSEFTSATRSLPHRQFWWSMVNNASSDGNPNEILVGQYQEDNRIRWSSFDVDFTAFNAYRSGAAQNWDDITVNWDEYDKTWDEASGASTPIVIAGDSRGQFAIASGSRDLRHDTPYESGAITSPAAGYANIPFSITTERLSPFPGYRAHLGWVDLYLEAAINTTLTIEFRGDSRLAAYRSRTLSISPAGANEKIMRRIKVNKTAVFHKITIRTDGPNDFAIEAIVPWFRPAGRLRNFG